MSFETDFAMMRVYAVCKAIEKAETPEFQDGPVYEDDGFIVEKRDGKIIMTGKPFRIPMKILKA